jgi:hypothetical protein
MENIKRELPVLAKNNLQKELKLNLRELDTKVLLNYADDMSKYLKSVDLKSKLYMKKETQFHR